MATVYKKTDRKPIPEGAEIVVRKSGPCARWKDAKGQTHSSSLTPRRHQISL